MNPTKLDQTVNWLVFDPSMKYTGWILYKPAKHKIIQYGCIRKKEILQGKEISGKMEERMAFEIGFSWALQKIMRLLDPVCTDVIMEEPIGSQSSSAAWALAMASQGVVSMSVGLLRTTPITYREREAKLHAFDYHTIGKQITMKHMWNYWFGQGIYRPESQWQNESNSERRKMMEAVADAMLILNLHLHKVSTE